MRMISTLCAFAFAGLCRAEAGKPAQAVPTLPVVAAERWIKSESDAETVWIDRMTDGTYRESAVKKQPTVVRTRLVATNDVGFAWRFDYEARLSDGSVVTNASFSAKPAKERLNEQIAGMGNAKPPEPSTNGAAFAASMERAAGTIAAPAAAAMARAVIVKRRAANTLPVTFEQDGKGHAVATYADGRKATNELRRVVSARIPSPWAKELPVKKRDASSGALAAAALAGALAGAAGTAAAKKMK